MDDDNETVLAFGVNSLASKFILDKKGNIRFNDNSCKQRNDALVDKISIAIEMLRGEK